MSVAQSSTKLYFLHNFHYEFPCFYLICVFTDVYQYYAHVKLLNQRSIAVFQMKVIEIRAIDKQIVFLKYRENDRKCTEDNEKVKESNFIEKAIRCCVLKSLNVY
jgi:hypothetical protein